MELFVCNSGHARTEGKSGLFMVRFIFYPRFNHFAVYPNDFFAENSDSISTLVDSIFQNRVDRHPGKIEPKS